MKSILRTKNVNRGVRAASTISYKMERKKLLFFHLIFLSPFLSVFFGKFLSSEELEFLEKETIYSEKEKKNEEGKKYKKMKK